MEKRRKKREEKSYEQRLQDMDIFIQKNSQLAPELDNDLVRRLIRTIKVISADKLMIQFHSGICVEQGISYE